MPVPKSLEYILRQKKNPYLRPLYGAMESLIPYNIITRMEECKQIEGIHFAYLNTSGIVRHPLIKKIIEAYESEKKQ